MRKVVHTINAHVAPVGTFSVRRTLPNQQCHSVGPWVFLDHFGPFQVTPGHDGVGPHPHAGIETVTYLLSGRNEHRDSAGHTGIVGPGGAQWMTAGRGIIHAEMPVPANADEMTLHGIQLWTTLPRAMKQMLPRYQRIDAATIPKGLIKGGMVRIVAGEYESIKGPAQILMPLLLWHVSLDAGASFKGAIPREFEVAAYVIAGNVSFYNHAPDISMGTLVVFADGEKVQNDSAVAFTNNTKETVDVLLLGGVPAEGPLVFYGPFVMNSIEQIHRAERAYRNGEMGILDE